MAISALSSAGSTQLLLTINLSGFQQATQTLGKNLAEGKIPAAKVALKQLQQLNANRSTLGDASPHLTSDLTTLSNALKAGKLDTAKSAFGAVQKDLTGTNAAAITASASAARQIAGQIDAALDVTRNQKSIGSLFTPDASRTDIASRTTAYLNIEYGHTNAPTPGTTGSNLDVSA